jgi:hypothetical protein
MRDTLLLLVFFCMSMAFMTLLPRSQPSDYPYQLIISLAAFFGAPAVPRGWLRTYIPVAFIVMMIRVNIRSLLLVTP